MMKYIYILLIAFFVGACNHVEKYSISGTWKGADGQIVCLLEGWGEDRVVDSAVRDGKFHWVRNSREKRLTLSWDQEQKQFYWIRNRSWLILSDFGR
ncbi:MAG: hypothetical protein ACLUDU_08585 [Butyricimonas faecihominis]